MTKKNDNSDLFADMVDQASEREKARAARELAQDRARNRSPERRGSSDAARQSSDRRIRPEQKRGNRWVFWLVLMAGFTLVGRECFRVDEPYPGLNLERRLESQIDLSDDYATSPLRRDIQPLINLGQMQQSEPRMLVDIPPLYIAAEMDEPIEGVVLAEFSVTQDGRVEEIVILDTPHPALGAAVEDALSKWWFVPERNASASGDTLSVRPVRLRREFRLAPTASQRAEIERRQ